MEVAGQKGIWFLKQFWSNHAKLNSIFNVSSAKIETGT